MRGQFWEILAMCDSRHTLRLKEDEHSVSALQRGRRVQARCKTDGKRRTNFIVIIVSADALLDLIIGLVFLFFFFFIYSEHSSFSLLVKFVIDV